MRKLQSNLGNERASRLVLQILVDGQSLSVDDLCKRVEAEFGDGYRANFCKKALSSLQKIGEVRRINDRSEICFEIIKDADWIIKSVRNNFSTYDIYKTHVQDENFQNGIDEIARISKLYRMKFVDVNSNWPLEKVLTKLRAEAKKLETNSDIHSLVLLSKRKPAQLYVQIAGVLVPIIAALIAWCKGVV